MADSFIEVPPDSTGKQVDTSSVATGSGTVQRQRVAIGDSTNGALVAGVTAIGLKVDTSGNGLALDASLTTLDTDLKATQPRDITDRAARLVGHVTVDAAPAVTGTVTANIGSTNGIALDATLTTIDNDIKASQPRAVTQTTSPWVVSGTVAATQGTSPWTTQDTPNSVGHKDMWTLIEIMRQMLIEIRACRLLFSTMSNQHLDNDDIDISYIQ